MNGTSDVGLNVNSIGFQLKLHLVKGIVGGNADDYGDIQFGKEVLAVFYCGDTHGGVWGIILSYIANM